MSTAAMLWLGYVRSVANGVHMDTLTCHVSRGALRLAGIWFSVFFCLAQWIFWRSLHSSDPDGIAIGIVLSIVFGLFIYLGFRRRRPEPYLVAGPDGLRLRGVLIPWTDIKAIQSRNVGMQTFMELTLRDQHAYIKRLSRWARIGAKLNSSVGPPVVSFMITALDVSADRVYDTIQSYVSSVTEDAA